MPLPHTETLLATIRALRAPGGCPWDRRQTLRDAARYLLEEAGELVEAALSGEVSAVREELADLLYMVCFCAEILGETEPADFEAIARQGNEKLVRRHPHVFGDRPAGDHLESQERWNEVKADEKRAAGRAAEPASILKDLPAASSPLAQACAFQVDAAAVGFDWPEIGGVWDKLHEEIGELREAADRGDQAAVAREVGDLLFAAVNLARRLEVPPDDALRLANRRFRDRFRGVEARYGWSRAQLKAAPLEALEAAWQEAKAAERGGGAAEQP